MVPVIPVLSLLVFSKLFAGFLLGRQPCRPIWCGVRRMVWALTDWPPTPSTSAAMLGALLRLFPKHNLWYDAEHVHFNFFGRPWRGLFWVEPFLINRFMVLATVLSSVSGSLKYSYSLRLLCVEQQFFFSDPQRVLCHEVPCWTSSDQYERGRAIVRVINLTHLLPIHTWDLVTLMSHMTLGRENG